MSKHESPTAIPLANPQAGYLAHRAEIDAAIAAALTGGRYILGPEVEAFEQEFARYLGTREVAGVANGTDAVELALRACGIEAGDIVFTVSHTAVATVVAIERIGAIPVLVDIDPATFTMSPECLEEAVAYVRRSPGLSAARAKAVVPVHLYGQPADLPAILDIARAAALQVVEDCAQAHGASLNGRMLGTWGDAASFSFYPTKNLPALGDGGAVASADSGRMQRVRVLRQYGWEERYVSSICGVNSRLDEVQAAALRVRLRHLDDDNRRRGELAAIYDSLLADSTIQTPARRPGARHVFHQYVIRTPHRDAIQDHLSRQLIHTGIHYPVPIHLQPAYRDRIHLGSSMQHTEAAAAEILSLPMYPELEPAAAERTGRCIRDMSGVSAPIA